MRPPTTLSPPNGHAANGHAPPAPPAPALRLPEPPPVDDVPGTRLVHRAVTITFALLVGAAVLALAAAFVIEIDLSVEAAGVLEPAAVWPVRSQETGMIAQMLVAAGDTVAAGQVLARLDPLPIQSEIDRLDAQLRALRIAARRGTAEADLGAVRRSLERDRAEAALLRARARLREQLAHFGFRGEADSVLARYEVGSHVGIDQALADVRSAEVALAEAEAPDALLRLERLAVEGRQADIALLESQRATLRERLARLDVRAPTAGLVLTDDLERLPGSQIQAGTRLLEIAEAGGWRAGVYVHQRDVHEIAVGDTAKLEIGAFRAAERDLVRGRVTAIAADGLAAEGPAGANGRYRVVVTLDEADVARIGARRLRRGYSVEAKIITRSGRIIDLLWRYLRDQLS